MDKTLLIIRHARSELNIRVTEEPDAKITDFGARQAHTVGRFMARHMDLSGFDFYTSPFLRCLQTAEHICKAYTEFKVAPRFRVRDKLREYINHGHQEVTIDVHRKKFPHMDWQRYPEAVDKLLFRAEQNEEILNRMHDFYGKIPEKSVVVTHGLPALVLIRVATGRGDAVPIWDHSVDNASLTLIKNGRTVWHGRNLYPEVEHDPFEKMRTYDAADLLT